jgi:hypothetical protein
MGNITSASTLSVAGNVIAGYNLSVAKNAVLSSELSVAKNAVLSSELSVAKTTTLSSHLSVAGLSILSSTLSVAKQSVFASTLSVGSSTVLSTTLSVGQSINVSEGTTTHGKFGQFGCATLGNHFSTYLGTTFASFQHKDFATNSTSYALMHASNGNTQLNANSGSIINFSIANGEKGRFQSNGNFLLQETLTFGETTGRHIQLYGSDGVTHDYSIGVTGNSLNHTVNTTNDAHRFWQAGNSGNPTGTELFRIGSKTLGSTGSTVNSYADALFSSALSVGRSAVLSSSLSVAKVGVFASTLSVGSSTVLRSTLSIGAAIVMKTTLSVGQTIHAAENITSASDKTFKTNIETLKNSLESIKKLRGVSFDWKTNEYPSFSEGKQIGLIAQEVREIFPELVKGNKTSLSLVYDKIVAILIEGIKDIDIKLNSTNTNLSKLCTILHSKNIITENEVNQVLVA